MDNVPFAASEVLELAKKRVRRRIAGARTGLRIITVRAESRGAVPKYPQYSKWIRGIGYIVDHEIVLTSELREWLK